MLTLVLYNLSCFPYSFRSYKNRTLLTPSHPSQDTQVTWQREDIALLILHKQSILPRVRDLAQKMLTPCPNIGVWNSRGDKLVL